MIKTEKLTINGNLFIRTYSDEGYMVERDGVCYSEAIDPAEFNRQYIETDELVEVEELTEIEEKALAYDIITGVSE
jgi:hypothetical protein